MAATRLFDLQRALLLPNVEDAANLDILEGDAIVHSEDGLDAFLNQLQGAAT